MKKIKQILSGILISTMLMGSVAILSGCSLGGTKTGTEAAKLMLANERLDEKLLGQHIDLGFGEIKDPVASQKISANKTPQVKPLSQAQSIPQVKPLSANDPAYTWSEFDAHNDTLSQFESFVINIDEFAFRVAEKIEWMKENVGMVDKWVKYGESKQMLRVYESSEVVIVDGGMEDNVYYRHTDENAQNTYEMYAFTSYDDGTTGEIRMLLRPGERYEYMYDNSSGFSDYVIMENSRGYWVCTRFNYNKQDEQDGINFTSLIIKDGFCYSVNLSTDMATQQLIGGRYSVVDIESQRELIATTVNEHSFDYTVHMSAIKDGFVKLGADEAYDEDGHYLSSTINSIHTVNGVYPAEKNRDADISFMGGSVSYDYVREVYRGYLHFVDINSDRTMQESLVALNEYLGSMGLTLYRDIDDVVTATEHARLYDEHFTNQFEWNGYFMKDMVNVRLAREVLLAQYDAAYVEFESVKDFESTSTSIWKASLPDFATMSDFSVSGENSYSDGVVTLAGVNASISDESLLEVGKSYVLKVALSLCDEEGHFISVNTVPLQGGEEGAVAYTGEKISLATKGDYIIPKNLNQGDYALVAYVATADEGIRISEMIKIGSFSTYDEKLTSEAMDITVKTSDAYLYVQYVIKNAHRIQITATKDSYSYAEIERMLMTEVLKFGAPFKGAKIEGADGSAINQEDTLGAGEYRLMCYLNTADGLAQSYVYLDLTE